MVLIGIDPYPYMLMLMLKIFGSYQWYDSLTATTRPNAPTPEQTNHWLQAWGEAEFNRLTNGMSDTVDFQKISRNPAPVDGKHPMIYP
jgi:hypothetical protein